MTPPPPPPIHLTVESGSPPVRVDKWLARMLPGHSRSELQNWIRDGRVICDGEPPVPGTPVRPGMVITVDLPAREEDEDPQPEDLPLEILYEDAQLVAVNKAPGRVVHPAPGHPGGTLLNAMLHRYPDLAGAGPSDRPGVVHRLDADTSGVLVLARTTDALSALQSQFRGRKTEKRYLAICRGIPHPVNQKVDLPIGRHPVNRKKRVVHGQNPKSAVTVFRMSRGLAGAEAALLEIGIETGRTHQIRVHLSHLGHPVLGDPLYGGGQSSLPPPWPAAPRLMLHAATLSISHPRTGERLTFEAPVPDDLRLYLDALS